MKTERLKPVFLQPGTKRQSYVFFVVPAIFFFPAKQYFCVCIIHSGHPMNLQDQLSHPVFPLIRKIAKQLESPAYLVGGYVRDLLIHRPSTDIDCTVMGDGIGLARALCLEIGKQTGLEPELLVFKQFGTCKFHYGDTEIEFVGARKESYTPGSRKPHVEQGGLEDDLNRRDFSINAMAVSLNEKDYGALIDPFQGLEDLDRAFLPSLEQYCTFSQHL